MPINAVFFSYFRDGQAEYLGRSWLKDPQAAEELARDREPKRTPGEWNGVDYYVMFGDDLRRSWEDARTWGYVSASGRRWSRPLEVLQPGARVFVHHPHDGYVGVGRVMREVLPITEFAVNDGGRQVPILEIPLHNDVPVQWEWTVPAGEGLWHTGFFFVRTTVAELRSPLTARQICEHAGIAYDDAQVVETNC